MSRFGRFVIAIVTLAAVVVATPAFAQTAPASRTPLTLTMPSFAPTSATPAPTMRARQDNEQGLGFFLQGGLIRATTYGENGIPAGGFDTSANGWILGIGFGGNKSGKFGIAVDINYLRKAADNVFIFNFDEGISETGALRQDVLQVPVYGRITFFGHQTKEAASLYLIVGPYVDILLKSTINGLNFKDQFNGFDVGILGGLGFEVARVGVEYRAYWALRALLSTGNGTFLNGLEDSKAFTHVVLFRVRLN
jgi:hypothetical protein